MTELFGFFLLLFMILVGEKFGKEGNFFCKH